MRRQHRIWLGFLLAATGFAAGMYFQANRDELTALNQANAGPLLKDTPQTDHNNAVAQEKPRSGDKLRIICFGAHPDDCEIRAAGVAAKWAADGHQVKFVSVTNGDIGHWMSAGGPLANRRRAEVEKAAKILGIQTQVLDIHDGELEPTLENRRIITRLIRDWKADIVMSHRPNDYHPDHRYTGVLVQDAAFMVTVPFFCPDTPHLEKNPVFLYYYDRFQRPNPFRADVVVAIDDVIEKKLAVMDVLESQFLEGGALGSVSLLPKDDADRQRRREAVRKGFIDRFRGITRQYRDRIEDIYGKEQAAKIEYVETFELCEYGSQPNRAELLRMFPIE